MWNKNYSQTFSSRSQSITPLNSMPIWNAQTGCDRDSYHQRQLQRLLPLGFSPERPPLQLGHLTPTQEDQVKRLRRLVKQRPPRKSLPRRRCASQLRSASPPGSSKVTQRPSRNRIRRPRKRVRKRPPNPGLQLFLTKEQQEK